MTLELGPNAYRYLTESRLWVFWWFIAFLWCKLGMAIILRPARGIRRSE